MNGRKKRSAFLGYVLFFLTIAVTVSLSVMIFSLIKDKSDTVVAVSMFAVIVALSALCTLIDALRRKFTVENTVDEILAATDKIAAGDFAVRLDIKHAYKRYDEFDLIKENLNKMAAELSHTAMLGTDFISNVSHEIKTPLAVIGNYAMLLKGKNLGDAEREKYASLLVETSAKLADLVTNILKLNKLENQEITADLERINLEEMLSEVVLGFEEAISEKGVALECNFEEVYVNTSVGCLELAVSNLMSNAVKFTENGAIKVSLKKVGGRAVISVSDTGCGISRETGAHIFEKFYQGDTSHSREGNGLGLALVKRVIDIIGGEISVESEVGKGSTFTVSLGGADNE